MILPRYLLINTHLRQITPTFHNHCPISVTLPFMPRASTFQTDKTIWIKIMSQLLIMQDTIDTNRQDYDEKIEK